MELIALDHLDFTSPGVYLLYNNDTLLYIGRGRPVLGRLFGKDHNHENRAEAKKQANKAIIFFCKTNLEAKDLEWKLISELKPQLNIQVPTGLISRCQHPDAPYGGRGLCRDCYERWYYLNRRLPRKKACKSMREALDYMWEKKRLREERIKQVKLDKLALVENKEDS